MAHTISIRDMEGVELQLMTIPNGFHTAEVLADEIQRALVVAYEKGRKHQHERVERDLLRGLHTLKP